ncbi:MAG: hypothetical protein V4520_03505 [Bacteroidota bacterium]
MTRSASVYEMTHPHSQEEEGHIRNRSGGVTIRKETDEISISVNN